MAYQFVIKYPDTFIAVEVMYHIYPVQELSLDYGWDHNIRDVLYGNYVRSHASFRCVIRVVNTGFCMSKVKWERFSSMECEEKRIGNSRGGNSVGSS